MIHQVFQFTVTTVGYDQDGTQHQDTMAGIAHRGISGQHRWQPGAKRCQAPRLNQP